jgi:hypothetical protein
MNQKEIRDDFAALSKVLADDRKRHAASPTLEAIGLVIGTAVCGLLLAVTIVTAHLMTVDHASVGAALSSAITGVIDVLA